MATSNYTLRTWAAGNTWAVDDVNKPNEVLDRALDYVAKLLPDGRYSGAAIATTKRIGYPGEGMVDGCAWSISSAYEETGTCQSGSSATQVKDTANLTQADGYWVGAWVFGESGTNSGYYRQVSAFDNASGTITVSSAFPSSFAVGDSYRVTFMAIRPDTLTNNVVNYVFGRRVTYATQGWTTEADGIIEFYASTSSTKPAGEIYLGTITLDGSGTASSVNNDPTSDVDTCYRFDVKELRGTSVVSDLAGSGTSSFYVTHTASMFPGAFTTLSMDDEDFSVELTENFEDDRFKVTVTNNGSYSGSSTLSWRRYAIIV
jgi:hypothetical protein